MNTTSTLKNYLEPGRGGEIRTPDILLPKQARYQATLHPEGCALYRCQPAMQLFYEVFARFFSDANHLEN